MDPGETIEMQKGCDGIHCFRDGRALVFVSVDGLLDGLLGLFLDLGLDEPAKVLAGKLK